MRLFAEYFRQRVVTDIGHLRVVGGDELAGGADGAGDKARLIGRAVAVCRAASQARGRGVQLQGALFQAVVCQRQAVGAEGIRFNHIRAGFQERGVHLFYRRGRIEHQAVVAANQMPAAEIRFRQVHCLQCGAHRAVKDQNALF